ERGNRQGSSASRGVRGKPKIEQPQYNGPENETVTEDTEDWAITKSSAGFNTRLECAPFFLMHGCLLRFGRKRHLCRPGSAGLECHGAEQRERVIGCATSLSRHPLGTLASPTYLISRSLHEAPLWKTPPILRFCW